MLNVLITGASGYLGKLLTTACIAAKHRVFTISRKRPDIDGVERHVSGEFGSFEDLRQFDDTKFDIVMHLAAETGGCSEAAGIETNVAATRRLIRYTLDLGCRRFILASSIAAVGSLDDNFAPLTLPIPDRHPYIGRDAYGLSKAMMEQLLPYFHARQPETSFTALRIGAVVKAGWQIEPRPAGSFTGNLYVDLGRVIDADVIDAFLHVAARPSRPGVHVYNLVAPDIAADDPTLDVVNQLPFKPESIDLAWYQQPANEYAPLYDTRLITKEIGFVPKHSVRR